MVKKGQSADKQSHPAPATPAVPATGATASATGPTVVAAVAPTVVNVPTVNVGTTTTEPQSTATSTTGSVAASTSATAVPAENATTAEAKDSKRKQTRRRFVETIGVQISTARVRGLLADSAINSHVHDSLDEIKGCTNLGSLSDRTLQYLMKYVPEASKPDEKKQETPEEAAVYGAFRSGDKVARETLAPTESVKKTLSSLVNHQLLRIGDDAVMALAATAHFVVHELSTFGVKSMLKESKKTFKTHHIANEELQTLQVWPFLRTLKCVADALAASKQRAVDLNAKAAEKKEKTKKKKVAPTDAAAVPAEQPAQPTAQPSDTNTPKSDDGKEHKKADRLPQNMFKQHACHILRKNLTTGMEQAGLQGGDISEDLKTFGSHLVYELVVRYSNLIRLQTAFAGVKTIKASTITTINNFLLVDAGVEWPDLDKFVNTSLASYAKFSNEGNGADQDGENHGSPAEGSSAPASEAKPQDPSKPASAKRTPARKSAKKGAADTPAVVSNDAPQGNSVAQPVASSLPKSEATVPVPAPAPVVVA